MLELTLSFRASDHTGVGISKYSLLYEIATPQKRLAMTYIVLDVTRYYKGETGLPVFIYRGSGKMPHLGSLSV